MNASQKHREIDYLRLATDFSVGRAWVEINMNNLRHNVNIMKSQISNKCQIMAVVKANAYGHGATEISKQLNACGIRAFCVASVLEGVELRKYGIYGEILILGYTHPQQVYLLKKYDLTQTVFDCCYAKTLDNCNTKLKVHIKIDTGMRRLGESWENISGIMSIFQCKSLNVIGVYTQMCMCDGERPEDKAFTQNQIDNFCYVISEIEENGFQVPRVHIQSSYGVLKCRELDFAYARVGVSLYGMLYSLEDTRKHGMQLRPVLSVKARISSVKTLHAGESIGYGHMFTAQHDMSFAVLAIGYADGVPRSLSCGVGYVLINGHKASVVGRICMDQMMVDITGIKDVRQGDIAVIIGKSGCMEITACEIAEQTETVSTEIVSRLGGRLEKVIKYG